MAPPRAAPGEPPCSRSRSRSGSPRGEPRHQEPPRVRPGEWLVGAESGGGVKRDECSPSELALEAGGTQSADGEAMQPARRKDEDGGLGLWLYDAVAMRRGRPQLCSSGPAHANAVPRDVGCADFTSQQSVFDTQPDVAETAAAARGGAQAHADTRPQNAHACEQQCPTHQPEQHPSIHYTLSETADDSHAQAALQTFGTVGTLGTLGTTSLRAEVDFVLADKLAPRRQGSHADASADEDGEEARYAAAEAHARARTRALAEAARMPRDALDGLGALPPYVAARRAAEALADVRGWRPP